MEHLKGLFPRSDPLYASPSRREDAPLGCYDRPNGLTPFKPQPLLVPQVSVLTSLPEPTQFFLKHFPV
jgi:hypothetical protein